VYVATLLDAAGQFATGKLLAALPGEMLARSVGGASSDAGAGGSRDAATLRHRAEVVNAQLLRFLTHLDAGAREDVARFLRAVQSDVRLIYDLTPGSMRELNGWIAGGDALPMHHFVSVAPRPASLVESLDAPVLRYLFWYFYERTADAGFEPAALPSSARWIGEPRGLDGAPLANDGVVPASSQALPGGTTTMVFGDHLDVVGHFPSRSAPTSAVFKSGAGFDDARFQELWRAIAAVLLS
jgi:hypothetical protein